MKLAFVTLDGGRLRDFVNAEGLERKSKGSGLHVLLVFV